MKVEVHRTIKNVFKAQNTGDKIVVIANWRLSQGGDKKHTAAKRRVFEKERRQTRATQKAVFRRNAMQGTRM